MRKAGQAIFSAKPLRDPVTTFSRRMKQTGTKPCATGSPEQRGSSASQSSTTTRLSAFIRRRKRNGAGWMFAETLCLLEHLERRSEVRLTEALRWQPA